MRLILNLMVLILIVLGLAGCFKNAVPDEDTIKNKVLANLTLYEEVAARALSSNVTRVSRTGSFPKGVLSEEEYSWFLSMFDQLGIQTGIQVDLESKHVEFIYWSSGIVSRGEAILLIKLANEVQAPQIRYASCIDITHLWVLCRQIS
ncbi:hypothetical protein [Pseudoalteromonas rubra]|uniref:Lipoprotein n=1 Tax=Pseudoalteromonas rubra TaxID=43658 RepID=A0A0F4QM65_9GAMM|nr:hypothetical protein [Pseudoalteromonas rubra]KJZ08360.1 hypothetical protein TW77_13220 [Pseudoalteromonas rubra]